MKKDDMTYQVSEAIKYATRNDTETFANCKMKPMVRNEDGTGDLIGLPRNGIIVLYERVPGGGLKTLPGKLFYSG